MKESHHSNLSVGVTYPQRYMALEDDVRTIALTMGLTSLVCSVSTILLICSFRKVNGYLLILFTITLFQVLYDINYILRFATSDAACYAGQFLDLVGGLGSSFWTNILTFSVTYTILKCESVQVFKHYFHFSLFGSVIPFAVGILALSLSTIETDDDEYGCGFYDKAEADAIQNIYYWGRLISVMITLALCCFNLVRLRIQLKATTDTPNEMRTARDQDYERMYQTIYRMNFYAIAQIISRSGAAWNEWDYGRYSTSTSDILHAITSPSMGILNFIIFLVSCFFSLHSNIFTSHNCVILYRLCNHRHGKTLSTISVVVDGRPRWRLRNHKNSLALWMKLERMQRIVPQDWPLKWPRQML